MGRPRPLDPAVDPPDAVREQYIATLVGRAGDALDARFEQYARQLDERRLPVLFSEEHLAHVVGLRLGTLFDIVQNPDEHYTSFRIPKQRGGSRLIEAPSSTL